MKNVSINDPNIIYCVYSFIMFIDNMCPFFQLCTLTACRMCKECCNSIPTCICGYQTIEFIYQNRLSSTLLQQFIIISVNSDFLHLASKQWGLDSNPNILSAITVLKDDSFHFLAIPKGRMKCPLLGSTGCMMGDSKPITCQLFPIYFHDFLPKLAKWCPNSNLFGDAVRSMSSINSLKQEILLYNVYSHQFQREYHDAIDSFIVDYGLHIQSFHQ
jgi:hypothetical protein